MLDSAEREFLLGFIAGEGSFMIEVNDAKRRRWGFRIIPRFGLLVHESDILHKLCDETNLGIVHERADSAESSWLIRSIDECLELCEIIDSQSESGLFEQTDKYNQYTKWKSAINMIDDGKHLNRDGAHKIVDMSYEIGDPKRRKYDAQYYHDKINQPDYICGADTQEGVPCQSHVAEADNNCRWHK
jgi:hypothetical protein